MATTEEVRHKRVLLKLSGEALTTSVAVDVGVKQAGPRRPVKGIKRDPVAAIVRGIKSVWPAHQVAITVGGGNILRGSELMREMGFPPEARVDCDHAGMVATFLNGIALKIALRLAGVDTRLMLAKPYGDVGEEFFPDVAKSHLAKGKVIILAGGTGRPRFTTDTGAILSAIEIGADLVLKGTKVDGIYDADPAEYETARRIPRITYDEFIAQKLGIMDTTAVAMARDNKVPIRVFDVFREGSLALALADQGTYSDIGPTI